MGGGLDNRGGIGHWVMDSSVVDNWLGNVVNIGGGQASGVDQGGVSLSLSLGDSGGSSWNSVDQGVGEWEGVVDSVATTPVVYNTAVHHPVVYNTAVHTPLVNTVYNTLPLTHSLVNTVPAATTTVSKREAEADP